MGVKKNLITDLNIWPLSWKDCKKLVHETWTQKNKYMWYNQFKTLNMVSSPEKQKLVKSKKLNIV